MDLKTELYCEAIRDWEEDLCKFIEKSVCLLESGTVKDRLLLAKMAATIQAGTDQLSYIQLLAKISKQDIA